MIHYLYIQIDTLLQCCQSRNFLLTSPKTQSLTIYAYLRMPICLCAFYFLWRGPWDGLWNALWHVLSLLYSATPITALPLYASAPTEVVIWVCGDSWFFHVRDRSSCSTSVTSVFCWLSCSLAIVSLGGHTAAGGGGGHRFRRWCASAGKSQCLDRINPQTDHQRVVSRNPCETLLLILRQCLLCVSAGVSLHRIVSCCPSCSLTLASLCGLAAAVSSGGPPRSRGGEGTCMCLPHLDCEVPRVVSGRDSWKILQSCCTLEDSLPLGKPLCQMTTIGIADILHDLSRLERRGRDATTLGQMGSRPAVGELSCVCVCLCVC